MTREAEIGVLGPQAMECWQLPDTQGGKEQIFSQSLQKPPKYVHMFTKLIF